MKKWQKQFRRLFGYKTSNDVWADEIAPGMTLKDIFEFIENNQGKDLKQATSLISALMDLVESSNPREYYRSDLIAQADNFLKKFD